MTKAIAPFGLRMPPALKAQVESAARAAGRSINAQVVRMLEQNTTAGLNVQQHVWLTVFAAEVANPDITYERAAQHADQALPIALKRLEELA